METANPAAVSDFDAAPESSERTFFARRWWLLALAILVVAGLPAWLVLRRQAPGTAAESYLTAPVHRADIVSQVTATGTLSPVVLVEVGSQVTGRIAQLFADFNSRVTAGQVIARVDPRLFETAVSQARARLSVARAAVERAEAVLSNARATHARAAELGQTAAISRAEVDAATAELRSAEAQVLSAKAEVSQARAALEQAEVNLAYTTITSPIDGIVVSRKVDVGQTVAASLASPTLFVIAEDLRQMEVHTSVAESDVGQLAAGLPARFTVDAFPQDTFAGVIKQVRNEAHTVSNVVTYDAVIQVANPELKLRPGMTASVTVVLAERRAVLALPNRALLYRPARLPAEPVAPGRAVWVLRDGKPVRVSLETGLTDGTNTEILSGGLHQGDRVIIGDGAVTAERSLQPSNPATSMRRPPGMF
jgi:HlyD family secretion protein